MKLVIKINKRYPKYKLSAQKYYDLLTNYRYFLNHHYNGADASKNATFCMQSCQLAEISVAKHKSGDM
jgi:hypothetical protein